MPTHEVDTSGWAPGVTVSAGNLGLPSGGTFSVSTDWAYGEDDDGVYLTNTMANWGGGNLGAELEAISDGAMNTAVNADGKAIHVWYELKFELDGDDGIGDNVTIFPWNAGGIGRFSVAYGNSGYQNNNDGTFANLKAVTGLGQKRGQHIPIGERMRFDVWIYRRGANDNDIVVFVNGRALFVHDGRSSNIASNAQRILWDPDIDNGGTQRVSQRLYAFGVETFDSGADNNYQHYIPDPGVSDDRWVMGNAIAPNVAAQAYADGAYSWSVTAGTPDHRHETQTNTDDKDKGYAYLFPADTDCVGTGREYRVLPSYQGRGVVGATLHVGSGPINADLVDSMGDVVAGFSLADGDEVKEITLRRGSDPVAEELTGISLSPGSWYEIVLHHGEGRPLGLTVQYIGTDLNWASGNSDRVMWAYESPSLSGLITDAVRPVITFEPAASGTEPYCTRGLVAMQRWPHALVSSYTSTTQVTSVNPASYMTTANMPDEGLDLFGDANLLGTGAQLFPVLNSTRGIGFGGRSGGAFINRTDRIAEYRVQGLGGMSYTEFFRAGHGFRVDLWDIIINSLSTHESVATSEEIADEVVAELTLLADALAANEILTVITEQVPPIDEDTGGGSTPADGWDADRTRILRTAVSEVVEVFRARSPGTFYHASWYGEGATLAEDQIAIYPNGDIHPADDRLVADRVWGSAERMMEALVSSNGDASAVIRRLRR